MEYYSKIEEPKKLRLAMMSVARDTLLMQSILKEIQDMRQEKIALAIQVKDDFKQIAALSKKLSESISDDKTRREILDAVKASDEKKAPSKLTSKKATIKDLPKIEIKVEQKKTLLPPQVLEKEPQNTAKTETPQTKTEVDRLEYTLSQIEKKIAELSK